MNDIYIYFYGHRYILDPVFFTANTYIKGGATCKRCEKKHLKKDQRVDVEFFGQDLVSYCLGCWPKEIEERMNR